MPTFNISPDNSIAQPVSRTTSLDCPCPSLISLSILFYKILIHKLPQILQEKLASYFYNTMFSTPLIQSTLLSSHMRLGLAPSLLIFSTIEWLPCSHSSSLFCALLGSCCFCIPGDTKGPQKPASKLLSLPYHFHAPATQ